MAKSLFLMFISAVMGLLNPGSFLAATDTIPVNDLTNSSFSREVVWGSIDFVDDNPAVADSNVANNTQVQEKTIVPEEAKVEKPVESVSASVQKTEVKKAAEPSSKPVVKKASVKPVVPAVQNYTVTRYINSVDEYNNTFDRLSYSDIYKFRKMIYGHNTNNLLGNLKSRYVGEIIKVTEGGVSKDYRVVAVTTYTKSDVAKLMKKIANSAMGHDVAFLTCAGTSLGHGDSTHRLVVLADKA